MHPSTEEAFQEIDAAMFSSDTFEDDDNKARLIYFINRWSRQLHVLSDQDDEPDPIGERNADERYGPKHKVGEQK